MGRFAKSPLRKELDSELLSLASGFVLLALGVDPPELLDEKIDQHGPKIKTLAEKVLESKGEDEIWRARKYAGKFAWNMMSSRNMGRLPVDAFCRVMDELLNLEPGLRAPY
jgi:hypothetical protein